MRTQYFWKSLSFKQSYSMKFIWRIHDPAQTQKEFHKVFWWINMFELVRDSRTNEKGIPLSFWMTQYFRINLWFNQNHSMKFFELFVFLSKRKRSSMWFLMSQYLWTSPRLKHSCSMKYFGLLAILSNRKRNSMKFFDASIFVN